MRRKDLFVIITLLIALALAGCGGGGGGGGPAPEPTRVSGIASKGIFTSGTVNLYALVNGKRGQLLKQAAIDPVFGTYSANLGSYVGPVVAEASGNYLDEATGTILEVPADAPIRAALPLAQGTVDLPVTALTEIAVQKTGGSFTPAAIESANAVVSDLFKVDIINTNPVAANAAALNSASEAQRTYTLALATVSQLRYNGGAGQSLAGTLAEVASSIDVASNSMTSDTATTLQGALVDFAANSNNVTGITDAATTPLANVGMRTLKVTVSVPGSAVVGAVQGTITMPAGVQLNMGSPNLSGAAVGAILAANPGAGALSIGVLSTTGFASGEILTFTCSAPSAQPVPVAADFALSGVKVLDRSQNVLPVGLSISVSTLTTASGGAGNGYTVTLSLPAGVPLLGGIQGTVTLPSGFTLNPGSPTLAGSAVGSLLQTNPRSSSFVFGIASISGFGSGPFLTFTCSSSSAGALPSPESVIVSGLQLVDTTAAPVSAQMSVAVQ